MQSILYRTLGMALVLVTGLLAGCPTGPTISDEDAVRQRVQDRWAAIIANEWDQVYEFTTPAYRAAYSKKHFFNRYGGQITREAFEIQKIEFEDPEHTTAKVRGNLHFSTSGVGPEGIYRGTQLVDETWVKVDGQWWHVERR